MLGAIFISILVSAFDCRTALLRFYDESEHARVSESIRRFSEEEVERLTSRLTAASDDPRKQLLEISSAYLEHLIAELPLEQQVFIRSRLADQKITKIFSRSAQNAEDMNQLLTNPADAFAQEFRERDELDQSIGKITLHRELNGYPISFYLDLLKEMSRLLYFENAPFYRKNTIISASLPPPIDTLAQAKLNQVVAERQWSYLALIPRARFDEIIESIERQRNLFLDRMPQEDGKKEIHELFDEVVETLEAAKDLSQSDFIAHQNARFNRIEKHRYLKMEIIIKGIWYGLVGAAIYAITH